MKKEIKKILLYISTIFIVNFFVIANSFAITENTKTLNKKGIGLVESEISSQYKLNKLTNIKWYYNWGYETKLKSDKKFIPMIFSPNTFKTIKSTSTNDILLGFNEPDNSKQSNLNISTAYKNWNKVVMLGVNIASPAPAGNLLNDNNWLDKFINKNPKIDYIAVHWYKGINAEKFIKDMENIIKKYNKPIIITEFAPQTVSQSKINPNKYTEKEVITFMKESVNWMENNNKVIGYAWHDSKIGTSAIWDKNKNLTKLGEEYNK